MGIKKELFGTLSDGTEIQLYTLSNGDNVTASFTNLGAVWVSMQVPDRDGNLGDVVLGYDTALKYLVNKPHLGAIIGRNANRIGGARFELNGTTYELAKNDGNHNLHSGPNYYGQRIWDTEVMEDELGAKLIFSLESPDGDQGFPGNATIQVSYTLTPDNSVEIDYYAVSDEDTIVNLTNHSYFNLAGHNSGHILEQRVWIDSDKFTVADEESIPTGEIDNVANTPMDFRVQKPIGRDINEDFLPLIFANGYDHNYILHTTKGEPSLIAKAYDDKTGRAMEVYTDLPGVHFYTGNFLSADLKGKGDANYNKRSGFCFETQYFPSAVTIPNFKKPILRAGDEYKTTTIYKFMVE